jgi:hypothetical protein
LGETTHGLGIVHREDFRAWRRNGVGLGQAMRRD